MADVRAMCAIGLRGQLGLNGRLPWEGNKGREYVADVARFFNVGVEGVKHSLEVGMPNPARISCSGASRV